MENPERLGEGANPFGAALVWTTLAGPLLLEPVLVEPLLAEPVLVSTALAEPVRNKRTGFRPLEQSLC